MHLTKNDSISRNIDLFDSNAVRYWTKRFIIDSEALVVLVNAIGTNAKEVENFIKGATGVEFKSL